MPSERNLETEKLAPHAQTLRSEMSAIVFDMDKLHGKTIRAIRSAARSYRGLIEHEKNIFRIGDDAADWPGEASRHFAICCFAKEFHLASQSLLAAPNHKKCHEGSTFEGAFKNFKYLRDSWEHPERLVKIAPEYDEYMAATEIDFEEDV